MPAGAARSKTGATKQRWVNVTRAHPCGVCGKTDWCSVRADGEIAACRRQGQGAYKTRQDRSGADVHLHRLGGDAPRLAAPPLPAPGDDPPPRAGAEVLDRVYNALLGQLSLSDTHRDDLRRRGLVDAEIDRGHYRSLPVQGRARIARGLHGRFGGDLLSVPGFYAKEGDRGRYTTIAGAAGLLVPVRDAAGRVIALVVRRDGWVPGEGNKYLWVSSASHGGPGPGSPPHTPRHPGGPHKAVRLTEGALKAEVATARSGVLTIGASSVATLQACTPVLRELGCSTVLVAIDADLTTNVHVARALLAAVGRLQAEGFEVQVERWDAALGKGIDDLLAGGHAPTTPPLDEALADARKLVPAIGAEAAVSATPNPDPSRAGEVVRSLISLAETAPLVALDEAMKPENVEALAAAKTSLPAELETLYLALAKAGATARKIDGVRRAVNQQAKIIRERAKAELATKNAAGPGPVEDLNDPHRLARAFLASHSGHVVYFREQFYAWTGTHWQAQSDPEMRAQLARYAREQMEQDAGQAGSDKPIPHVTTGLVANVMQAAAGDTFLRGDAPWPCWVEPGSPPESRNYLALANGLLDVDAFLDGHTHPLRPHDPRWFSPICLPYPFDPGADCPRWKALLRRNLGDDPGKPAVLQEWAGYTAQPDTSFQKALLMTGEGANGKSVICAVFNGLLGDGNVSTVPLEFFGDKFRLVGTLGKLLNLMPEVGEIDKAAEGFLKAFIVGDPMEFERKHKQPFTARPTARIMLATNNLPQFSDKSDGIWRRLLLLPCTVQIPKEEQVPGMDRPEWWQERGEFPGILNWALEGLRRLRQQGRFTVPASCQQELARHRQDCNPARRFLTERYDQADEPATGEGVPKDEVYREYTQWCADNGHRPMASNTLGKEVARTFKRVKDGKVTTPDGSRANAYLGLLRRAWDEEAG